MLDSKLVSVRTAFEEKKISSIIPVMPASGSERREDQRDQPPGPIVNKKYHLP